MGVEKGADVPGVCSPVWYAVTVQTQDTEVDLGTNWGRRQRF
jgi:hypothetical protein